MQKVFKWLLPILISLACWLWPRAAQAQFIGYTAGQTVTKAFSVSAGTPTPVRYFPLPNYGQVGHSIVYKWGIGNHCVLDLQVSGNGTDWNTIASGPSLVFTSQNVTYANGYFPFLRIAVNPNLDAGCQVAVSGTYIGYQFPILIPDNSINVRMVNITTPQPILASISDASIEPLIRAFECHNPNGATAYLQLLIGAGGLGTGLQYEIGIPTGQTFVYPGPAISIPALAIKAGAATAAGGNVAVGTALVCNFQINPFGPFLPSGM